MEELLQLGDFDDRQRHATLVSLVAMAKVRRQLEEGGVNHTKPAFNCPEPGAGVPVKSEHVMEDFHYKKFRMWAEDYDFCSSSLGLWTGGCGAVCGLRAAVVGHMVQLRPGQLVLDVGSGCGHFAEWFYDWFGAQTIGVDFQKAGVDYANHYVATSVPAQFCWMDVASQLSSRWLPARSVDLAIAISVLHYLRSDKERWEAGDPWPNAGRPNVTRTPCYQLASTEKTQCRVAWEMFRAVKVGGHVVVVHNAAYKGKWDPKRTWGRQYWKCCFHQERLRGEVVLLEARAVAAYIE
ncbi:unnamed protein product [Symbiodinium microadriaticum]|nr:unnamed protein product [Symbiodinium microadriaticum]